MVQADVEALAIAPGAASWADPMKSATQYDFIS
jgi:hypothetical protein